MNIDYVQVALILLAIVCVLIGGSNLQTAGPLEDPNKAKELSPEEVINLQAYRKRGYIFVAVALAALIIKFFV